MTLRPCALLLALLPLPASANCIPPWQLHFACEIPERDASVEFCRIADTAKHPGLKEGYYSYVTGTGPADLYFQTDEIWFSTKDTNINHPTDLTMAMGYKHGPWVYGFTITQDSRIGDRIRDAEVRVYRSTDDFSSDVKDVEATRLYCDPDSIRANQDLIAP